MRFFKKRRMKTTSLFLFFTALWFCTEATLNCEGTYECLPGSNDLAIGFDIVTGTKFTDPNVQIFDLSLTDSPEIWLNPASQNTYYYPSIMKFSYNENFEMELYLHRNASSYAAQLTQQVGVSAGYCRCGGCFELSEEVSEVKKHLSDAKTVMVTEVDSEVYYSLGVNPTSLYSNFSSEFLAAVAGLTGNYLDPSYSSFVKQFGTHWVYQVDVGGRAIFTYYGDNDYSQNVTDVTLTLNARLSFLGVKLGSCGVSASAEYTSQFESSVQENAAPTLIGGDIEISQSEPNWFSSWLSSVYTTPVSIQTYVTSISMLIEDSSKRNALEEYIQYYISSHISKDDPTSKKYPIPLSSCATTFDKGLLQQVGVFYHDDDSDDDFNYNVIKDDFTMNSFLPCYSFFYGNTFEYPYKNDFINQENVPDEKVNKKSKPFKDRMSDHIDLSPRTSSQVLGGVDTMGISIDLLTGKKKMQQVVNFSYNNQNTWTNPYSHLGFLYPDQMSITSIDKTYRNTNTFTSPYDYAEHASSQVDDSFSIPLFSFSHDVSSSSSIFVGSQSVMGIVKEQYVLYQAYLNDTQITITEDFQSAVDNLLTEEYDESVYAYFVSLFGTAVITSAQYGGEALMRTIIDQNYYSISTVTEITTSLDISFDDWNAGIEYGTTSSAKDVNFATSTLSLLEFRGGSFASTSYANWDSWVDSIPSYPFQVSFTTKNITYYISDSTKRANMEKFLEGYYYMSKIEKQNVVQTKVLIDTYNVDFSSCDTNDAISNFKNEEYVSNVQIGSITYYRYAAPLICGSPYWSKNSYGTSAITQIDCVDHVSRQGDKSVAFIQCPDGYYFTNFSEPAWEDDYLFYNTIVKYDNLNIVRNTCCKYGYYP